jgi:hypothetical protein
MYFKGNLTLPSIPSHQGRGKERKMSEANEIVHGNLKRRRDEIGH